MFAYTNKTHKTKSQFPLAAPSLVKRSKSSVFQFKDNRPKPIMSPTNNTNVIQRMVTNKDGRIGDEVKCEGKLYILKEWTGRGWFVVPKDNTSIADEVFRASEDLELVNAFNAHDRGEPSTKRADTKDDGEAKAMTTGHSSYEGSEEEEYSSEGFVTPNSSFEYEDDMHIEAKIPQAEVGDIEQKESHTWESYIDKLTDMVESESAKFKDAEEPTPTKQKKESKRERKDASQVNMEKLIAENTNWITEREVQLRELTTDLDDAIDTHDRTASKRINEEIDRITELLKNKLRVLHESWGIPGVGVEGDRSPRVFPDAKGILYYFGELPEKINTEFEGVKYATVSESFIKEHKNNPKYTYPVSYGIDNVIYTTDEKDNTKNSVLRDGSGKGESYGKAKKQDYEAIEKKFDKLKLPELEQYETYVGPARRRSRGAGQFAAMEDTNAAAYAFGIGLDDKLENKWEWLHIRGAGLGGYTESFNLVAGTYSANSHMIPYENQIKTLSAYANPDQKLFVEWKLTKGTHKFTGRLITIKLWAPKGLRDKRKEAEIDPIPENKAWTVGFDPMRSVVFDKFLRHTAWVKYKQHRNVKK